MASNIIVSRFVLACGSVENQSFHRHLNTLAMDDTISVTKFDKGNGVCILQKEDYLSKLDDITNDTTKFSLIPQSTRKNARHPLMRRQEVIISEINKHVKKFVPEDTVKSLKPSGCNLGKLYGTSKVHKAGYPIRPIVSMVGTPEYNLARYLDGLIKPNLPTKYSIRSNGEYLELLKTFNHVNSDYVVSFDVVSLFTNIPLGETITMVSNVIYSETAVVKPPMPKASFISLLKCATGGMFSHRGKIYKQHDGVTMGNPLAPTLANFFLGYMETELLEDNNNDTNRADFPALYVRYVDDVFCIFRKDDDHRQFLKRLNNLHQNLSFTCEFGGESIPFLDMRITLEDNKIKTNVFRKKTNTDVFLHYKSNVPTKWKVGLIKCFIHRAKIICSDKSSLNEEMEKLREIFSRNGYPKYFFDKISSEGLRENSKTDCDADAKKFLLKVPYVGKPSISFSKKMKQLVKAEFDEEVRTIYQTDKVGNYFTLKCNTPDSIVPKVVYQFTCPSDSEVKYIGYTNRSLGERVKDHLRGGTAISDHIDSCKHCRTIRITIDNFKVLKKCRTNLETMIFEAIFIKRNNPSLNHQLIKPGRSYFLAVFD